MTVHEVASAGFGAEAAAYERSRPSYPQDAVAWLVEALRLEPEAVLLDLAAGTGKFTRLLAPFCRSARTTLLAVEPVTGMSALLRDTVPSVPLASATAEALPFADGSLHGIVVAQAFHWFDAPVALGEFLRVLPPGGRVGLIWNARDRSSPWVDRVWSIMDGVEKRAPWRTHDDAGAWQRAAFVDAPGFSPLTTATFHQEQILTPDAVIERVRSVSHVAVLPRDRQEAVLDEVRAILRDDPSTAGRAELALPYRVDAYWAERI
jgi:SAM-dependent methyltransferase